MEIVPLTLDEAFLLRRLLLDERLYLCDRQDREPPAGASAARTGMMVLNGLAIKASPLLIELLEGGPDERILSQDAAPPGA